MTDPAGHPGEVELVLGDLARRLELLEELVRDLVLRAGPAAPEPAARAAGPRAAGERWLVVGVDGRRLGLPLEAVREVVRNAALEPVPGGAAALVGLLDLRGQPVEVIDLRAALGCPPLEDDLDARIVVCHAAPWGHERTVGVLVDEAAGLVRVDPATIEPAPGLSAARYLVGVVRAEAEGGGALLLVDPGALLEALAAGERLSLDDDEGGQGEEAEGEGAWTSPA